MKRIFIILIFSIVSNFLQAQDPYDQFKTQYDRLRKEAKHDSALVVAKQMNTWALKNETDTGLRYAVSLRYIGNCYNSLKLQDSTLVYWIQSAESFQKFYSEHIEYAASLNNLGNLYSDMSDYKAAEPYYQRALEIKKKTLGEDHSHILVLF
jgi:tetratricopeptide (TPR) repeat protein